MGAMILKVVENVKSESERPEGAGRGFSSPPRPNQDLTPYGASSPTRPVSNQIQFGNLTLQTSGEAAVAGYGLGRSLGSGPWNRPLEKAGEDVRGDWCG